jgi:hypothetical protein
MLWAADPGSTFPCAQPRDCGVQPLGSVLHRVDAGSLTGGGPCHRAASRRSSSPPRNTAHRLALQRVRAAIPDPCRGGRLLPSRCSPLPVVRARAKRVEGVMGIRTGRTSSSRSGVMTIRNVGCSSSTSLAASGSDSMSNMSFVWFGRRNALYPIAHDGAVPTAPPPPILAAARTSLVTRRWLGKTGADFGQDARRADFGGQGRSFVGRLGRAGPVGGA